MKKNILENIGFKFISKRLKPLCFSDSFSYFYKKGKIFTLNNENKLQLLIKIPLSFKNKVFCKFRITERFFRLEPQSALIAFDCLFVALHDGILCYNQKDKTTKIYKFRKNYIHTSELTLVENIKGFDNCVVFGEYFYNENRESVRIYALKNLEKGFESVYEFPKGAIRHIHCIKVNTANNCIYALTGDETKESGIFEIENNFKSIKPIAIGNQKYRAVIMFFDNSNAYYATDYPSSKNHLCKINLLNGSVKEIEALCGPCTVGAQLDQGFLFSSSVETIEPKNHSKLEKIKYLLSHKIASGILDNKSRLYYFNGRLKVVSEFKKDCLSAGAFRFGRIIPYFDIHRKIIYLYCCCLKRIDGKLYFIKEEDFLKNE